MKTKSRKINKNSPNIQELNTHINKPLVQNVITREVKKYFVLNRIENTLSVYVGSSNPQREIYSFKCLSEGRLNSAFTLQNKKKVKPRTNKWVKL